MKDQIANLALMAGGNELIEAAQYYENIPGQTDKAVMLYHKVKSFSFKTKILILISAFSKKKFFSCFFVLYLNKKIYM